jgi:ATP-dependent HslUV protease, peptidase subunit HslV
MRFGSTPSAGLVARATTVLAVRAHGKVALGGDGQVTLGETVVKSDANKVRKICDGKVLCGFAGSAADAFALLERFEGMMKKYNANVQRAAIELAKEWRLDRALRRLESMLAVCDRSTSLVIGGSGDVIEPPEGLIAIGSGSGYARSAALALLKHTELSAREIVTESLRVAGEICIYTNQNIHVEELEAIT